jgi:DNA repair exonuclease SbcCD ATPase subunit
LTYLLPAKHTNSDFWVNSKITMKIKIALISLLIAPVLVFAQNGALPNAGLTPESPFYFLDRLGEALREFFTFNPEGKARLQVTFAAERVAEIKVVLETKGVEAKGLEVAQSRLQAHLAKTAIIVTNQKSKGEDVSTLAKELDERLETPKSALADSFKAQKQVLEAKEDELKAQLKAAHRAGDTAQAETLAQELGRVKAQKELLELKEEDIEDELEAEEEKIEEEMEAQHKAEKTIQEAEEEKQEIIDEAAEEGIELPTNAFAEFDSLLAQAKNALQAGNFVEAKNLAKRAEKSLDQIEKTIEELEKKQEKKEEAEEALKEAEDERQEVLNEASKEGIDLPPTAFAKFDRLLSQAKELFAKENYQGAKQLAEQAEDALEDVDKEVEKLEKEKEGQEERAKGAEERRREQEEKQQEEAKDQDNENEEK